MVDQILPNKALREGILPAYAPCAQFAKCPQALWRPEIGHIPRGVLGATGALEEVRAIMVFGEQGGVYQDDFCRADVPPDEMLAAATTATLARGRI